MIELTELNEGPISIRPSAIIAIQKRYDVTKRIEYSSIILVNGLIVLVTERTHQVWAMMGGTK